MLVRLLYASRADDSVTAETLAAILRVSKERNHDSGVTGVLCHCASSKIFMQVLEGGRGAVSTLYGRIARDPRHHDVVLLSYEEIGERRFAHWSMGHVNMNRLNPGLLLRFSETSNLDPYGVSGQVSMRMFEELVATASVSPG